MWQSFELFGFWHNTELVRTYVLTSRTKARQNARYDGTDILQTLAPAAQTNIEIFGLIPPNVLSRVRYHCYIIIYTYISYGMSFT